MQVLDNIQVIYPHFNMPKLNSLNDRASNVLSGIAYDSGNDVYYMTGKNWGFVFKIRIYP